MKPTVYVVPGKAPKSDFSIDSRWRIGTRVRVGRDGGERRDVAVADVEILALDRNARLRLHRQEKMDFRKARLRLTKWVSWFFIGLATGGGWVFYLADARTLLRDLVLLPLALWNLWQPLDLAALAAALNTALGGPEVDADGRERA